MASPQALGLDEHDHHHGAPPNVTTLSFTHAAAHPAAHSCPPSPTALAAATTLATLADGRPLHASHAECDEDDDDDYGGGIAITSADLHEHTAGALADTYITEQDMADQLASVMPSHSAPMAMFDSSEPMPMPMPIPSYQLPSIIPHLAAYTSSSDPVLEPLPPTLQEAHLSIEDNGSFAPITSFFHRITPARPTVPGLDLVDIPATITRDQLQGDRFDPQGIDWTARNTTRAYVRAKRAECEAAQLPPRKSEVRKVSSASLAPLRR
jgi:hypothetical protein